MVRIAAAAAALLLTLLYGGVTYGEETAQLEPGKGISATADEDAGTAPRTDAAYEEGAGTYETLFKITRQGYYQPGRISRSRIRAGAEPGGTLPAVLGSRENHKQRKNGMDQGLTAATEQVPKSELLTRNGIRNRPDSGGSGLAGDDSKVFLITAYTAGYESTGKRPGDKGYGITATGTKVKAGHTIAADWDVLPPGTVVQIEGLDGQYTVEDRGGAVDGDHIDLYIPRLADALEWGKQYREVTVIEWGEWDL